MSPEEPQPQFIDLAAQITQDPRGLSLFPFPEALPPAEAAATLASFHLVSVLPGQLRGQHYHPHKTEWLYLFNGSGRFLWRAAGGQLHERLLTGDQTLVIIPPGLSHTLINDGPHTLYLLAWRRPTGPGHGDPDTVPDPLVEPPPSGSAA